MIKLVGKESVLLFGHTNFCCLWRKSDDSSLREQIEGNFYKQIQNVPVNVRKHIFLAGFPVKTTERDSRMKDKYADDFKLPSKKKKQRQLQQFST